MTVGQKTRVPVARGRDSYVCTGRGDDRQKACTGRANDLTLRILDDLYHRPSNVSSRNRRDGGGEVGARLPG